MGCGTSKVEHNIPLVNIAKVSPEIHKAPAQNVKHDSAIKNANTVQSNAKVHPESLNIKPILVVESHISIAETHVASVAVAESHVAPLSESELHIEAIPIENKAISNFIDSKLSNGQEVVSDGEKIDSEPSSNPGSNLVLSRKSHVVHASNIVLGTDAGGSQTPSVGRESTVKDESTIGNRNSVAVSSILMNSGDIYCESAPILMVEATVIEEIPATDAPELKTLVKVSDEAEEYLIDSDPISQEELNILQDVPTTAAPETDNSVSNVSAPILIDHVNDWQDLPVTVVYAPENAVNDGSEPIEESVLISIDVTNNLENLHSKTLTAVKASVIDEPEKLEDHTIENVQVPIQEASEIAAHDSNNLDSFGSEEQEYFVSEPAHIIEEVNAVHEALPTITPETETINIYGSKKPEDRPLDRDHISFKVTNSLEEDLAKKLPEKDSPVNVEPGKQEDQIQENFAAALPEKDNSITVESENQEDQMQEHVAAAAPKKCGSVDIESEKYEDQTQEDNQETALEMNNSEKQEDQIQENFVTAAPEKDNSVIFESERHEDEIQGHSPISIEVTIVSQEVPEASILQNSQTEAPHITKSIVIPYIMASDITDDSKIEGLDVNVANINTEQTEEFDKIEISQDSVPTLTTAIIFVEDIESRAKTERNNEGLLTEEFPNLIDSNGDVLIETHERISKTASIDHADSEPLLNNDVKLGAEEINANEFFDSSKALDAITQPGLGETRDPSEPKNIKKSTQGIDVVTKESHPSSVQSSLSLINGFAIHVQESDEDARLSQGPRRKSNAADLALSTN